MIYFTLSNSQNVDGKVRNENPHDTQIMKYNLHFRNLETQLATHPPRHIVPPHPLHYLRSLRCLRNLLVLYADDKRTSGTSRILS